MKAKKSSSGLPVLRLGYAYQHSNFAEIGFAWWYQKNGPKFNDNTSNAPRIIYGPSFGTDISLDFKNFMLAPRAGYEFYFTPLCFGSRINITDHTNFKKTDLRIIPEIGFTIIGVINIFYGYSFSLNKNETGLVGRNRISVFLNIPTILSGNAHSRSGGGKKNRARLS